MQYLDLFFEVHNKAIQIIYSSLLFSKHTILGSKESYSGGGTTIEQLLLTEYAEKNFNQTFDEYVQNEVC